MMMKTVPHSLKQANNFEIKQVVIFPRFVKRLIHLHQFNVKQHCIKNSNRIHDYAHKTKKFRRYKL